MLERERVEGTEHTEATEERQPRTDTGVYTIISSQNSIKKIILF